MSHFDFSEEVDRARAEAKDQASRLSARTEIGRKLFPGAVKRAGFFLLPAGQLFSPGASGHVLVIGVATSSDPDLAALDRLAQHLRGRDTKAFVFDIDDWGLTDILSTFPGVSRFLSTPMVAQYRDGTLTFFGEGHDAIRWLDQI
jgi:hypothetical protein